MKKGMWFCLFFLLLLAGCSNKNSVHKNTVPDGEDTGIQIGMIFDTYVVERWQRDRDVFVSAAKELGAEVNVQNANGDVEEQVELMHYFIRKKADVIVVIPIDSQALADAVQEAKDAGIKVIAYDRLLTNAGVDLYVSFDNQMVGSLMGEAVSRVLKKGDQVVMICGPTSDNNVSHVKIGFQQQMDQNGITVSDIMYADGWKAELAAEYINRNIDRIKDMGAIMCGNDDLAGQAVRALAENRLAGRIYVVGQDADLAACQRIVEGTQYMTVYKPVEKLARCAAGAAVELANGRVPDTEETIMDGTYQVPYIKLEPIAVTAENMDEVIVDSGFHLKEDIYLDRPDLMKETK